MSPVCGWLPGRGRHGAQRSRVRPKLQLLEPQPECQMFQCCSHKVRPRRRVSWLVSEPCQVPPASALSLFSTALGLGNIKPLFSHVPQAQHRGSQHFAFGKPHWVLSSGSVFGCSVVNPPLGVKHSFVHFY